jgi:hypothetical protein
MPTDRERGEMSITGQKEAERKVDQQEEATCTKMFNYESAWEVWEITQSL